MRLFVAIPVPERLTPALKRVQSVIDPDRDKLKMTTSFHITIRYLGEQDREKTEEIKRALTALCFAPFALHLTALGFFGRKDKMRVVWAGLAPSRELDRLFGQLSSRLCFLDLEVISTFHPHITLARARRGGGRITLPDTITVEDHNRRFTVRELVLYESRLSPAGASYKPLHSVCASA